MNRFALLAPVIMGCLALQPGCSGDSNPPLEPDADEGYARGLTYRVDDQDYYLDGPMENGARDIAGHDWKLLPDGTVAGRHFNTGPFGLAKWWSSDAEDGQLLYRIHGVIDTWNEEKANEYHEQGYVHYHKLVTVDGRQPHPTKIMWAKHTAVASFTFDGGPMPWHAHAVTPGVDFQFMHNHHYAYPARERLLYVGCVDVGGQDPDFMLVVGADPEDPETYGKIVHRTDMPEIGDELHHYGFNVLQTQLLVPGLFSGRLHLLDIETDPARPTLLSHHADLTADSGYAVPHTVIGMPDGGYLVSMIGNADPDGPGGLVLLDDEAKVVGPFGPAAQRTAEEAAPHYMYDIGINLIRNRMISTTFGLPKDVAPGLNPAALGNEVYVWDYKARKVLQTVDLGPQTGALEVRWLEDPGSTIGFTNAPGTSEIWRWHDLDLDGVYEFEVAIKLPEGSIPTDMLISSDDRFLYVSNWVGSNVMQFDIRDPFNPILVSQVPMLDSQMMRLSPDNRRLYVTNSLLSTWDDSVFPEGVTRNQGYGIFLIDVDHENGGMTVNPDFHVDLMSLQKKNTVGPARPHQVFFDPGVLREFGAH